MHENLISKTGRLFRSCQSALEMDGVDTVDMEWSPNAARGPTVSVSFKGWSPTLHETWVQVLGEPFTGVEDEDTAIDRLLLGYQDAFARQRRRCEDAARLGRSTPFPKKDVDHLWVDEAMAPLARTSGTDLHGSIRDVIGRVHRLENVHRGGALHQLSAFAGAVTGESKKADTMLRYACPSIKMRTAAGRTGVVHSGHMLTIQADRLPQTLLMALVGRPLRDLAEIHPKLNDRTIRLAENENMGKKTIIRVGIDQHLQTVPNAISALKAENDDE